MPRDDAIQRIIRSLETDVERAVHKALDDIVVPEAQARCPVGPHELHHLRDQIHTEVTLEGVYVVAGDEKAWYGHLVEFGSHHRPEGSERVVHVAAHPFLIPAFEANREAIVEAARLAVEKACR